jgi:hypothetical protein
VLTSRADTKTPEGRNSAPSGLNSVPTSSATRSRVSMRLPAVLTRAVRLRRTG